MVRVLILQTQWRKPKYNGKGGGEYPSMFWQCETLWWLDSPDMNCIALCMSLQPIKRRRRMRGSGGSPSRCWITGSRWCHDGTGSRTAAPEKAAPLPSPGASGPYCSGPRSTVCGGTKGEINWIIIVHIWILSPFLSLPSSLSLVGFFCVSFILLCASEIWTNLGLIYQAKYTQRAF